MKRKILINAKHPEEKRVAIVEDQRLVDFYMDTASRELIKGNIYKGVVKRVEPSLRAAFVDFGSKKHGFLQFRDIKAEYLKTDPGGKRLSMKDALSKGQELIVQVERDARDTKGASLTTHITIPGRYLVMTPGNEGIRVSRKITEREDRDSLKEMAAAMKLPPKSGIIIRTASSDKTGQDMGNDLKYLTKLWNKIQADSAKAATPSLIYQEQDISVRTVRDFLTSDVSEVLIDDAEAFRNIKAFLRKTMPWRKINVTHYKGTTPLFDKYSLEDQISRLYEKYVHLPSGGYIVLDKAEALTAIDVNSGRSKKDKDMESMALNTNLEAADEIARQLRLRDIGGLIVIDFIDMSAARNRREVEARQSEALARDRAQFDVVRISKLGLMELTRERMRAAHLESSNIVCPTCAGAGLVKDPTMAAMSAFRELQLKALGGGLLSLTCRMPADSANYLTNAKRKELIDVEKESGVSIRIEADATVLPGQHVLDIEKLPKDAESHKAEAEAKAESNGKQEGAARQGNAEVAAEQGNGETVKKSKPRRKRSSRKKVAAKKSPAGTDASSQDTELLSPDAGVPSPDAGVPSSDAGVPSPDTGVPSPDAGVPGGEEDVAAVKKPKPRRKRPSRKKAAPKKPVAAAGVSSSEAEASTPEAGASSMDAGVASPEALSGGTQEAIGGDEEAAAAVKPKPKRKRPYRRRTTRKKATPANSASSDSSDSPASAEGESSSQ